MEVRFHRLVARDLRVALAYYDHAGGSKLGDRFFLEVEATVKAIGENPKRFHPVGDGLRRAPVASFPYHFLFEERGTSVRVLVLRYDRRHPRFGYGRR